MLLRLLFFRQCSLMVLAWDYRNIIQMHYTWPDPFGTPYPVVTHNQYNLMLYYNSSGCFLFRSLLTAQALLWFDKFLMYPISHLFLSLQMLCFLGNGSRIRYLYFGHYSKNIRMSEAQKIQTGILQSWVVVSIPSYRSRKIRAFLLYTRLDKAQNIAVFSYVSTLSILTTLFYDYLLVTPVALTIRSMILFICVIHCLVFCWI